MPVRPPPPPVLTMLRTNTILGVGVIPEVTADYNPPLLPPKKAMITAVPSAPPSRVTTRIQATNETTTNDRLHFLVVLVGVGVQMGAWNGNERGKGKS